MIKIPAVWTYKTTGAFSVEAMDLCNVARENKANVIEGAASVEQEMVTLIAHYFYGEKGDRVGLYDEFKEMILETDWCSFAAKKKMIAHILEKRSVLNEKLRKKYLDLLQDTMTYRNAFAHGEISADQKSARLTYFQNSRKEVELTDEFLRKVEVTLSNAFHETRELCCKIGAVKMVPGVEFEKAETKVAAEAPNVPDGNVPIFIKPKQTVE